MNTRVLATVGLLCALAATPTGVEAAARHHLPDKVYDLSSGSASGDRARGPRRIVATNLNTLRYDYSLGRIVAFAGPGDLWSHLLGATAVPPQQAPSVDVSTGPAQHLAPQTREAFEKACIQQEQKEKKVPDAFDPIYCEAESLSKLIRQETDRINDYAKDAHTARGTLSGLLDKVQKGVARVTLAGRMLKETLQKNSPVPNGTIEDIDRLLEESPESAFLAGTRADWASSQEVGNLRKNAGDLKSELQAAAGPYAQFLGEQSGAIATLSERLTATVGALKNDGASDDSVQACEGRIKDLARAQDNLVTASKLLQWATKENEDILAAIPDLEDGSAKQRAFAEARDKLLDWKARMVSLKARWVEYKTKLAADPGLGLSASPFSVEADGDCEFAFGGTKTTTVTITRVDQLPGNNTSPEQVLAVTIECTSPFTVSAGVAFSSVLQQEFAIRSVPDASGGAAVDRFVTVSKSNAHPVPLGMIHARFCEPNEAIALHATFGLAGNLRSQGAGGSDAEFLFGVSISLFRTMFITPGVYLGRRVDLSSGFKEGSAVPTGMTESPLRKSYQARFGLAITFTKP